ncbi:hypothetical protein BHE74_00034171 [Ensete ventricosum]|nr:hypothetical protein BHE74_00034171 [Ensete ventricosum]
MRTASRSILLPIFFFVFCFTAYCNEQRRVRFDPRYYVKSYEYYYGPLNKTYAYRSPRDNDGHGTHTASTVAGRAVRNVSALGGFAWGTATGGAPLARLAIYKVCWPIPGPNPNIENTCFDADMLAAFDDAIADGVHVISMSIGTTGEPPEYSKDSMAIGALHAAKRDIVVVCSAGNDGPGPATVTNLAPWMITVGASSVDRAFDSLVLLGNGVTIKVVLCLRGSGLRVAKGLEVKRAGGAAIILGNAVASGNEIPVDAHVLPGTAVSSDDAIAILKYIDATRRPSAKVGSARTVLGVTPAPVMAAFSSRALRLAQPDITAPGLNILAAWSESSSPTKLEDDHRSVKYDLYSGTSMSCPHVSAVAALLKSLYPDWRRVAGPMDYGSGHIRPAHASEPGLVYDASYEDYLLFACSSIGAQMDPSFRCPETPPSPSDLNYPSIAVSHLNGSVTVRRTVTNVGRGPAKYRVTATEPTGVSVHILPQKLRFKRSGQRRRFSVTLKVRGRRDTPSGDYVAGSYTWSDGTHVVRSPIVNCDLPLLANGYCVVGASSIDRAFDSLVLLGNGVTIKGETVTPYVLKSSELYPLVYAGDAVVPGTPGNVSGYIFRFLYNDQLLDDDFKSSTLISIQQAVPAQFSGCQEGEREDSGLPEREWAQSGQRIGGKAGGWRGYHTGECGGQWQRDPCGRPRPPGDRCVVRRRNSHPKVHQRSPQAERKDRLGSDCFGSHAGAGNGRLLVPRSQPRRTQHSQGLNILAAWSESSSPTKLEDDHRSVKYNLYSGTSMSCPHVSAVAALLKSLHPDWSSSAIRSAMMTTGTPSCVRGFEHSFCPSSHSGHWLSFFSAAVVNTRGAPLTDAAGQAAGPLELGSGHVRPNHASDPGLVYDASYEDYLLFACSSIGAQMDPSFPCPETSPSPSDLNYPSIAISDLNGSVTVRRTVTNVGPGATRYRVTVTEPTGVSVSISPGVLSFKRVGQKKSFSVTLKARGTPGKVYVAGSYTWSDGAHVVRSPIVVSVA